MAKLLEWISKAIEKVVDPDKEQRITDLSNRLYSALKARGEAFSLEETVAGLTYSREDLDAAKTKACTRVLSGWWQDEKLSRSEQKWSQWLGNVLQFPENDVRAINLDLARAHFARLLAKAMEDGTLSIEEESSLRAVAASVGTTMEQFVREFFRREAERFLRGIFLACVADGRLCEDEWNNLLAVTQKLGIRRDEMLEAIVPQAQQFVERVLADAKADGRLSHQEETTLRWLFNNLLASVEHYRQYVEGELGLLRALTNIQDGKLPVVQADPSTGVKAGEIVHFQDSVTWRETRQRRAGAIAIDHQGMLTVTDNRVLFSSITKSQAFSLRKVAFHRGGPNWIEIQVESKPATLFLLSQPSPIPYAVFRTAVAMANQTVVAMTEKLPDRHIPRDVRQRVWQRYAGRCAECSATIYLEFDHIVPVSRGGSNSEANIQLLCRGCNLKKSDHI